jgi:SPP1 gp7 family putative phage head morphogenesis protein
MNITHSCNFCISNSSDDLLDIFGEHEINTFLAQMYAGNITSQQLSVDVYQKVARELTKGVYEGFGKNILQVQWGTPNAEMLSSLRENVYIFSGAKNYQMTKDMSQYLATDKGLRPFNEFANEARKTFDTYNKNYLTAEYNSAVAQSRMAAIWQEIEREKHLYPMLQYETVGDGRVRPEHAVLDGIVKPVDDKFWNKFYPPNGWNCRCFTIQSNDAVATDLTGMRKPNEKEVPEIFRFNSGKTKQVFSPKHPYFNVAKEDKELAKTNFGLPIP